MNPKKRKASEDEASYAPKRKKVNAPLNQARTNPGRSSRPSDAALSSDTLEDETQKIQSPGRTPSAVRRTVPQVIIPLARMASTPLDSTKNNARPPGSASSAAARDNNQNNTQLPGNSSPPAMRGNNQNRVRLPGSSSSASRGDHQHSPRLPERSSSPTLPGSNGQDLQPPGYFQFGARGSNQQHFQFTGCPSSSISPESDYEVVQHPGYPSSPALAGGETSNASHLSVKLRPSQYDSQILVRQPKQPRESEHIADSTCEQVSSATDTVNSTVVRQPNKRRGSASRDKLEQKSKENDRQDSNGVARQPLKQAPRKWVELMPPPNRDSPSPPRLLSPAPVHSPSSNFVGDGGINALGVATHAYLKSGSKTLPMLRQNGNITHEDPIPLLDLEIKRRISEEETPGSDADIPKYRMVMKMLEARGKPNNNTPSQEPPKPEPSSVEYRALALGKIGNAKDDGQDCNFCCCQTSYGNGDEGLWLPFTASNGQCCECREEPYENAASIFANDVSGNEYNFGNDFPSLVVSRYSISTPSSPQRNEESQPHTPIIKHIGDQDVDVSTYMSAQFCSGCPWSQLDINLLKICRSCREEKMKIIKHRIHQCDVSIYQIDPLPTDRRCHICTGLAAYGCNGCPLLMCPNCSSILKDMCKSKLTNLFFAMKRMHIRNDAFILRDDGGGF